MDLITLRNTVRNWFREKQALDATLDGLTLVTPNEGTVLGQDQTWMRLSVQTGDAAVIGIGTATKRRRRVARVFIEIFGEEGVGDGQVTRIATVVEQIWRDAMPASAAPHPDILVKEPSTFERAESDRYCQVVSVPIEVDNIS
jgi:hypothetical protein